MRIRPDPDPPNWFRGIYCAFRSFSPTLKLFLLDFITKKEMLFTPFLYHFLLFSFPLYFFPRTFIFHYFHGDNSILHIILYPCGLYVLHIDKYYIYYIDIISAYLRLADYSVGKKLAVLDKMFFGSSSGCSAPMMFTTPMSPEPPRALFLDN